MNPFSKQNVIEALDRAIEIETSLRQELSDKLDSERINHYSSWIYDDFVIQSSKSQNKLEDLKDLRQYVINIQQINPLNYSVNLTQEQFKLIQDHYQ